ncbi:MAG: TIGR03936 family radical SAM-associated protein [Candidatus Omnitrophota bacterium]
MHLEVTFCKKGILRYISHLDLLRLFHRAVRRSDLPVSLSEGYSPRYRISFANALKLGKESDAEKAVFKTHSFIEAEEFKKKINEKLPEGIKVLECKKRF